MRWALNRALLPARISVHRLVRVQHNFSSHSVSSVHAVGGISNNWAPRWRWLSTTSSSYPSSTQSTSPSPPEKKLAPTITQNYPVRPWLESPVDLRAASREEAIYLWTSLGGEEDDVASVSSEALVNKIAEKTFQIAISSMNSSKSVEELEEVRSLLAIAVAHGNPRAKIFCANLFLVGEWPVAPSRGQTEEEHLNDKRTAKEKGMEVIKQIRAIQKKRKKGERFDSKPPKDIKKAIELFREIGAQRQDIKAAGEALVEIGDAHFFPNEDFADESVKLVTAKEALMAYETAATALSFPGAWYRLGSALEQGSADGEVPSDPVQAMKCFQRAVDVEDDPEAHVYLAHYYRTEGDDASKAKAHLLRAAQKHQNSAAQVYLARWALEEGREPEALEWLVKAEKQGDPEAAHLLADAHLSGSLGLEKDYHRALKLYRMAGEGGSEEAWLSAGALHFGMEEYEDAFKSYEQAAEMGSADAWTRIADLYMTGRGVPQNKDTAMRILQLLKENQAA